MNCFAGHRIWLPPLAKLRRNGMIHWPCRCRFARSPRDSEDCLPEWSPFRWLWWPQVFQAASKVLGSHCLLPKSSHRFPPECRVFPRQAAFPVLVPQIRLCRNLPYGFPFSIIRAREPPPRLLPRSNSTGHRSPPAPVFRWAWFWRPGVKSPAAFQPVLAGMLFWHKASSHWETLPGSVARFPGTEHGWIVRWGHCLWWQALRRSPSLLKRAPSVDLSIQVRRKSGLRRDGEPPGSRRPPYALRPVHDGRLRLWLHPACHKIRPEARYSHGRKVRIHKGLFHGSGIRRQCLLPSFGTWFLLTFFWKRIDPEY